MVNDELLELKLFRAGDAPVSGPNRAALSVQDVFALASGADERLFPALGIVCCIQLSTAGRKCLPASLERNRRATCSLEE